MPPSGTASRSPQTQRRYTHVHQAQAEARQHSVLAAKLDVWFCRAACALAAFSWGSKRQRQWQMQHKLTAAPRPVWPASQRSSRHRASAAGTGGGSSGGGGDGAGSGRGVSGAMAGQADAILDSAGVDCTAIEADEIQICRNSDGSPHLLGHGAFGHVRPFPMHICYLCHACACKAGCRLFQGVCCWLHAAAAAACRTGNTACAPNNCEWARYAAVEQCFECDIVQLDF